MARIKRALIIGNDIRGYQNVLLGLTRAECMPLMAANLAAATDLLNQEVTDLIALDLGPFLKTNAEARLFIQARKGGDHPQPVLGLVPTAEPEVTALFSAVDDLVLAPFRPAEIALRAGILLKRFSPADDSAEIIRCGKLVIDRARYEVTLDGGRLDLTFKEYELLRFLASRPGNVFTREILLDNVWGYDYFGGTRTVDVHIRRLRSKIEATTTFIETVRNVGYRFREPE